ncbi:hypothetical protein B0H67DRAFT_645858 [Lasiosphaeris hirsuta]|uniref:Uncharacterized protein n=1 Tax=Lasiosphaeris hirsuta TaxID=260670 RepID=A0AA40AI05_9PEZI|nr:hypothetical protein B0H67DRAFT_645858 [Lasiosphaeris hirsuta]
MTLLNIWRPLTGDSKHEKALRRLAAECSELSVELMSLLKKLKRHEKKNSVWGSLRVKWASIRKASDVESMVESLREYRSEIMLRLILMMSDQQSSIKVQLEQIRKEASQLNTVTAPQLDTLRSEILAG